MHPLFHYLTAMKKITILAISAILATGCQVVCNDEPIVTTDTCNTVLVPDTAPDSIQKTQYPDSTCKVTSDSIK